MMKILITKSPLTFSKAMKVKVEVKAYQHFFNNIKIPIVIVIKVSIVKSLIENQIQNNIKIKKLDNRE